MSVKELPKTFLFLDIETSGLKPDAELLELAAVLVRSKDLVKVSDFKVLVKPMRTIVDQFAWDPAVVEMHSKNGLLADIAAKESLLPQHALEAFVRWLSGVGLPAKSCVIAGSSVHTDVAFLKRATGRHSVKLEWEGFSHRLMDLSTIRTFDLMTKAGIFPDVKKVETHRAMDDVLHDIEQLSHALKMQAAVLMEVQLTRYEEGDGR